MTQNKLIGLALFVVGFATYLYSCAPHLAPYRDAGEMTMLLHTLGVAHPPGYPLYAIVGNFVSLIPWGNPAYVSNIFSALMAAGALVLLYSLLVHWTSNWIATLGALAYGSTIRFWELAAVQEMYSFGFMWLCLLLFVYFVVKNPYLFTFLFGLGLGIRMDMLLLLPLFIGLYWWEKKQVNYIFLGIFFGLGLSVFMYMPLRSLQDPLLDWANPEKINNFVRSVTRASYAGTLDLLSLNYEKGENLPANLKLYTHHLKDSFGWLGLLIAIVGSIFSLTWNKTKGLFLWAAFIIVGPIYLFLANMPPNPHAVAVVEANYPVADLFIAIFFCVGLVLISQHIKLKPVLIIFIAALILFNAKNTTAISSKRDNLYVIDYLENVYKCLPPNSILAADKDVQIFSLWETHLLEGRRKDMALIAEGLSSSPWFWDMKKRWDRPVGPQKSIKDLEGWLQTKHYSGSTRLFGTQDISYPNTDKLIIKGHGMLNEVLYPHESRNVGEWDRLHELFIYRGVYKYGQTPDFFSTDLIGDHSKAYHRMAFQFLKQGDINRAITFNLRSRSLDPTFARAASDLGYIFYTQKDYPRAIQFHKEAIEKYEVMELQSEEFNSLENVKKGIQRDMANAYVSLGASYERMGDVEKARQHYDNSISVLPTDQAHYNMAVTYWNKDWSRVVHHLDSAVLINPQNGQARGYLEKAKTFLK